MDQTLAGDLLWQAQIACLPHSDQAGHSRVMAQISELRVPRTELQQSVYEQANPEDRKRLIGSALDAAGLDWLKSHPRQANWLILNNVTVADCLREFREYYARELAFEGFTPARRKEAPA